MTRFAARFALLFLAVIAFPSRWQSPYLIYAAPAAQSNSITPAAFTVELRQLKDRLSSKRVSAAEIAETRASIPASWEIDSSERHYSIPSRPLTGLLRRAETDSAERAKDLAAARDWISDLRAQVADYVAQPPADNLAARNAAKNILARREFAVVGQPNVRNELRRKINEWLTRLFIAIFSRIGSHPVAAETLFWLIVAAIVAWLAMMLFRFWMRNARLESIEKITTVAFHRPWQEWIRAAREAAARGDFREAIHCTYWAGISRLETIGVLAPDPARTPRESLRVLDDSNSNALQATTQQRESLAALTTSLEHVWYGKRPAGQTDFQDCLRQAEELGCRVL
jgi:Domain of unknown function (DUF4129)